MKNAKVFVLCLLLFVMVFCLVACGDTDVQDEQTFTIYFYPNNGTTIDPITIRAGETIVLPPNPTMEGFTFAGWMIDDEMKTAFEEGQVITSDIFLYAKWEPYVDSTEYSLTFMVEGMVYAHYELIPGQAITLPEDPKTQQCRLFTGWVLDESGQTSFFDTNMPSENITLYANIIDNHTPVKDVGYAATCTTDGLSDGYHCEICKLCIEAQQTIPATGHVGGEETCEHGKICTTCGTEYTQALGHIGGEATCTEKAICTRCGNEYGGVLGHDIVNHAAKEPTCTEAGWYAYETCSRCDHTTYQERKALGHDEISHAGKDPTCTEDGWEAYVTCSRCNYTTYKKIDALGHGTISHAAKEPTCTDIGWYAYETCSRCDHTTYQERTALGHEVIPHEGKDPTCTENGWEAYVACSRCDYTTYQSISAHHIPADAVEENVVNATCTADGSYDSVVYCSICKNELSRETKVINALGHDKIDYGAKAPTCTEVGWYAYETCSRCEFIAYQEIPALGHDEIPHEGKEATCTEGGWEAYVTCARCDYTTYSKIDAFGHGMINHAAKAPTCTEVGWYAYETCSRCDHTTYQEIPTLGHDEIPHECKEATCTEYGWSAYVTCSRCDYTTYSKIDALGHDEISHDAKEQTCTEVGWKEYITCSRCDYTTYKEIPCHKYDEYEHCITCGYFDSGLLLELNSDGKTYSVVGIREGYTATNIEIPTVNYDTTPIVVTTIADNAFSGTNIETIVLSDSVTTIGANAFADCASLIGILLADGVESIGENAFLNCTALTEVVVFDLNNWLQIEYENEHSNPLCYDADLYIMDMDLGHEVVAKEITIPTTVEDVDFDVLATCKSLEKVNVENRHINYQSQDGVVYDALGENILFVPVKLNGNIELLNGITKIEDYTFSGMDIETVILSDSVTSIGANAFADCASLIGILLADGVESIGENAFLNCTALEIVAIFSTDSWLKITYTSECSNPLCYGANLYIVDKQLDNEVLVKEITIPTTTENVDFDVLATCKSLEKVNVENGHINYQSKDGVVYDAIGENILFVPTMIKGSVELLDGVRSIGEYAFAERIGLTEIIVPYSVKEIREGAFNGCESLKHVEIEYLDAVIGSNAFCGVANGVTFEGSISVVKELINATDVLSYNIIIIYATSITSSDFAGDTKLVGIVIPDIVETIAEGAFSGCSNLESITVPFVGGEEDASSASRSTLFGYIFGDTQYDGSIETKQSYSKTISTTYYIPASLKNVTVQGGTIYYGAFMNCANIVCVTIGEDVTKIRNNIFPNCSSLTTINWNAVACKGTLSLDAVCDFSNCDNFTILNFGEKVTHIPEYTFRLCENLTSLTIGGEVTAIGQYAFSNCTKLESVTLGNKITSIGYAAFSDIDTLKNVYISDMDSWLAIDFGDNPLKEGGNLYLNGEIVTSVVIPDGCTNAGAALGTCSTITSVEGGAEEVLNFALASVAPAYKLIITSGTLEANSLQENSFSACAGLVEVEIRNGVTIEGASSKTYGVFAKCTKLEKVTIDTAEVGAYAFYQCTSLKYVVLGSNVTSVEDRAFNGCNVMCAYSFGYYGSPSAQYQYNYNEGYLLSNDGYITKTTDNQVVLYHYIGLDADIELPKNVNIIGYCAFASNADIQSFAIGTEVTTIEQNAFNGCSNLTTINYDGTIEEWNAIDRQEGWNNGLGEYTINCSDGVVAQNESVENETE